MSHRSETEIRRDPQFAVRALAAVGQARAGQLELADHFLHGAEEEFALFGEHQAAGMAVEQRRLQIFFQSADLTGLRPIG